MRRKAQKGAVLGCSTTWSSSDSISSNAALPGKPGLPGGGVKVGGLRKLEPPISTMLRALRKNFPACSKTASASNVVE